MKAKLKLFIGRDKGKATIVCAPDAENAQQMVDASTKLYLLGELEGRHSLEFQGALDAEKFLLRIEAEKE